ELLANDVVAELYARVADEHGRPGDELADFVLTFSAERAVQQLAVVGLARIIAHSAFLCSSRKVLAGLIALVLEVCKARNPTSLDVKDRSCRMRQTWPFESARFCSTASIRPYSTAISPSMKWSRSLSRAIFSTGWPVCLDRISFSRSRSFSTSRA